MSDPQRTESPTDRPAPWRRLKVGLTGGLAWYRRILVYVRPYWLRLALAAAGMVAISLLSVAMPWAVKLLIDSVITGHNTGRLNLLAAVLAAIFVARTGLSVASTYLISWVGERVVASLRRQVYQHLMVLPLRFYDSQRVGEIVSRLTNDVQIIQSAVTSNVVVLLQEIVTAVGVVAVMLAMNWRLTALMMVAAPGVVIVSRLLGRRIRRIARLVQEALAQATAVATESVSSIRVVQSFAREEYESDRFGQKVQAIFDAAMQRARVYATLGPLMSLLIYGSMALVLWAGGSEVIQGRLTPGELIAFLLLTTQLAGPVSGLAGLYGQIQTAMGATERVFELIDTRSEIVDAPDAVPLPAIAGDVLLDGVSFAYDARQPVLRDISLHARPGQVVALVGPSGVGKTTVVHLIPHFYNPSSGRILIDGIDVQCVTLRSLRDQIGIVPQETLLFNDTIAANIRYGRLDATQDEIEAAARAANADRFITEELPDGYQTQVGARGIKLSGGQRQRVAIARAILKDPRILILDEATSSLDTESERLVQEALDRLMHPPAGDGLAGRTTFVIAHRLSTIVNADWIVVMQDGRIAEQGTHAELLAREGSLYRHYYSLQFQWEEERSEPSAELSNPVPVEEEAWADVPLPFLPGTIPANPYIGSPASGADPDD